MQQQLTGTLQAVETIYLKEWHVNGNNDIKSKHFTLKANFYKPISARLISYRAQEKTSYC